MSQWPTLHSCTYMRLEWLLRQGAHHLAGLSLLVAVLWGVMSLQCFQMLLALHVHLQKLRCAPCSSFTEKANGREPPDVPVACGCPMCSHPKQAFWDFAIKPPASLLSITSLLTLGKRRSSTWGVTICDFSVSLWTAPSLALGFSAPSPCPSSECALLRQPAFCPRLLLVSLMRTLSGQLHCQFHSQGLLQHVSSLF